MSRGPYEGDSRAGPQGRSLVIPEITPEGGSFQFFSFSVPLGLTETKNSNLGPPRSKSAKWTLKDPSDVSFQFFALKVSPLAPKTARRAPTVRLRPATEP